MLIDAERGASGMTSRERVLRALTFTCPDRAPRDLWMLGTVPVRYGRELAVMQNRFPNDFVYAPVRYGPNLRTVGRPGTLDGHTDEWGCRFEVLEEGVHGEVMQPALDDWAAFEKLTPPDSLLDGLDLSAAEPFYDQADKFVLCGSTVQPFQRLLFLRGFANTMEDVAREPGELHALLAMLHAFYVRELTLLAPVAADAICFKDDWGTQTSLLISPRKWRKLFKPLYAEYCRIIHGAGKYVFFHSDGQISSIYGDLVEIGVDAINSQLFCMDIEALAARYKGRITFWGEIDRQHVLAYGSPADVRAAVQRVRDALDDGSGGLIAQCEWGSDNTPENIAAVFEAWLEPLNQLRTVTQ